MRLVGFTSYDGRILINPDHVVAIDEHKTTGTSIYLDNSEQPLLVDQDLDEVARLIVGGKASGRVHRS